MRFVAHAVGADGLPFPYWFLAYGGVAAVLLTALWLRTSWPSPHLRSPLVAAPTDVREPATPNLLGRAVGLVLLTATIAAALVGPDSAASNIAPVAVTVVWWVGLPLLCLLAGDAFRVLSPFDTLVAALERALPRRQGPVGSGPSWTAAAFIFAFAWYWLAYHRPGSARALAVFLLAYTLCAVIGGLRWGRRWVRHGEGFAALSASVAAIGLRQRRAVIPAGVVPLAVVWLGSTLFDSISSSDFWVEILGTSTGWERTALDTVGLVWCAAIVAGLLLGAARVTSARDNDTNPVAIAVLGRALVPIAVGWFIAHDLTLFLFEGQNFLALLSDPLGRGWDLFGTIATTVDYSIVQADWVRAAEASALVIGNVGAVVVAHDAALRRMRRRAAIRITWAAAGLAAISIVAAVLLIFGGD